MASASDLPPPAEATAAAADPASSSKRRWSPCTWRYAIEDSQPELPSRQRFHSSAASPATRFGSEQPAPPPLASSKSRHGHQDHAYGKEPEEPARRSSYPHRSTEPPTELRTSKHGHSHEMSNKKKRTSPPNEQQSHHLSSATIRHSPTEEEEDNEVEGEDEGHGDDAEFGYYAEEGTTGRRKRQMSPSELYFCEICRAKAEAAKGSTMDSPDPSNNL